MKFRLGPPPDTLSVEHLANPQWRPLRQLPMWALQLLALPLGGFVGFSLLVAWSVLWPSFDIQIPDHLLAKSFAVLAVGIPLQFVMHPGWGLSSRSTLGFWPSRLLLYSSYDGYLSGRRYVWLNLLPFVALGLAPLLLSWASGVQAGWMVFVSSMAGLWFSTNAVIAGIGAYQLPSEVEMGNIAFKQYWRPKS